MNSFSIPGRLSISLLLVATMTLFLGAARTASAQRQPAEEDLKPIPSGPGIQVCEPVAPAGVGALADFGSGCGLWLQWAMGFQPELGQTPFWVTAGQAQAELHVPRLRLSLAQGARLYNILGVTHIAVGQITGTEAKCQLTYQLYAVPSQKAVGAPIKLAGTEEQALAGLPDVARKLLAGLGAGKPRVPALVGATPAEMRAIGHYGWYQDQKPTEAEQKQIDTLGLKLPLATLLSFEHNRLIGAKIDMKATRHLVEQASGNFLMLGALANSAAFPPQDIARLMDSQISALAAPNNAVLSYRTFTQGRSMEAYVRALGHTVRLAPRSANDWRMLAQMCAMQGQSIRQGRVYAALSAQERDTLNGIYARWRHAAARATVLDPDYVDAWLELATAATFAGDSPRADAAFWKAQHLDKGNVLVYYWGLEMYQPKWGGDPKSLTKVAHLAVTAPFPPSTDLYRLGKKIQEAGCPAEANAMFARAIAQVRERVRRNPKDSDAHATLGSYLFTQQHLQEAATELQTAIRLNPNSNTAHDQLGRIRYGQGRYADAAVQFRECLRLANNAESRTWLAASLARSGQLDEAEKLLRDAVGANPKSYSANMSLGWVLAQKKNYKTAILAYQAAERSQPGVGDPHRELCQVYLSLANYAAAVQEGELAVHMGPQDSQALACLAKAYAFSKNDAAALRLYRQANEIDPKNAQLHFDLGQLLLKMGKKDEGRVELKRVLTLKPTAELKRSTQELLGKNP